MLKKGAPTMHLSTYVLAVMMLTACVSESTELADAQDQFALEAEKYKDQFLIEPPKVTGEGGRNFHATLRIKNPMSVDICISGFRPMLHYTATTGRRGTDWTKHQDSNTIIRIKSGQNAIALIPSARVSVIRPEIDDLNVDKGKGRDTNPDNLSGANLRIYVNAWVDGCGDLLRPVEVESPDSLGIWFDYSQTPRE